MLDAKRWALSFFFPSGSTGRPCEIKELFVQGVKLIVLFFLCGCVSYSDFFVLFAVFGWSKSPPPIRWLRDKSWSGHRTGVAKSPGARRALLLMEMWQMTSCSVSRRTQSNPWHAQALTRESIMWKGTKWLTLLTVVELVELTRFRLPLAKNQVVGDVSIGVVGRLPLEDDLGRGVGWRDGVQRDGRF